MKVIKQFVEAGISRNIPYPFAPGEEVDVPNELGLCWEKAGLAKPLVGRECAMAAPGENAMKASPKPRRKRS